MLQVNKIQKVAYRKGSLVSCDYYPGVVFKVVDYYHEYNGDVIYTLRNKNHKSVDHDSFIGGLKGKFLSKLHREIE
jgi:hypothetical protein